MEDEMNSLIKNKTWSLITLYSERPETKRGPGRPKIIRRGKPGRPRKSPNLVITNIEVLEEANSVEVLDPRRLDEALEGPDADEWTDYPVIH